MSLSMDNLSDKLTGSQERKAQLNFVKSTGQ